MNEKSLTNKIIKTLNGLDGCWVYKRYGASGNEAGKPDITGIFKGLRVELEVKAPNRRKLSETGNFEALETQINENMSLASKLQRYYIKKFKELGAITGVVTSIDQALYLINRRTGICQ